eukprot:5829268-Pyramimonas_sp.AAC.1
MLCSAASAHNNAQGATANGGSCTRRRASTALARHRLRCEMPRSAGAPLRPREMPRQAEGHQHHHA